MSEAWRRRVTDPNPWVPPSPLPGPLETPRALIRAYEKGDGPRMHEAIAGHREALLPWMLAASTDHQVVEDSNYFVERCIRTMEKPECNDYLFGVFEPRSGALLGGVGIHRIERGFRCGEIGYWIRGDWHGRGLATEVAGHLTSSALTPASNGGWGFRRAVLFCDAANVASARVADKLGYRLEQRCRAERYTDYHGDGRDPYVDTLGFAVLATEWDFTAHRAKRGIGWPDFAR